jgi:hypothetical protein
MQRTRFEAEASAVVRSCEDRANRGCTVTFLGVGQHGSLRAATTATACRENKTITATLRLWLPKLESAQEVRRASSQTEAQDSGGV